MKRPPQQLSANFADFRSQQMHTWVPDTGSNSHVTQDTSTFDHHEPYYGDDFLHVGNGKGLPILHVSSTSFHSPSKTFSLPNILHVPEKRIFFLFNVFVKIIMFSLNFTPLFLLLRTSSHAPRSSRVQVTTNSIPCISDNFVVFRKSLLQLFVFLQTLGTKDLDIRTPNF